MLKSAWIYRFLHFYANSFLLSELVSMNRLLRGFTHRSHILLRITQWWGSLFIDGKCFNGNYRLVSDVKCSSCNTF